MIARRIHELIRDGSVYDKETETLRRIRYSDIVILARSIRGWAETCSAVLGEEGIPAYSVSREGYFETYEVSVLLDYLRILDNARQDLPLAAVLTSAFLWPGCAGTCSGPDRVSQRALLPGSADVCGSTGCRARTRTACGRWNRTGARTACGGETAEILRPGSVFPEEGALHADP